MYEERHHSLEDGKTVHLIADSTLGKNGCFILKFKGRRGGSEYTKILTRTDMSELRSLLDQAAQLLP
jgi:hypothetical protein